MSWVLKKGKRVTHFELKQVAHITSEKEFKEFFEGKGELSDLSKIWKEVKKGLGLKDSKPESKPENE